MSCWLAPRHLRAPRKCRLDAGAVKAAIFTETNAYRASKNIPELQENAALEAATTAYAVYLAEHEKVGHTADGKNPPKCVSAQGYKYCFISENVWSSSAIRKRC